MKHTQGCRDRLLTAARDLFAKHGYDGTSVRAITTKANANLGAITYHFGSKKALYHACIESFAEPLATRVEAAAHGAGSALDRVEAIVRTALDHFAAHPGAPTILLRELANDRPLPPPIVRIMKRNLTNLAGTVAAGQRDGSVRAGDPMLLALSVMAQPFHLAVAGRMVREVAGIDRDDPALWPRIVDHVALSVRHTLADRSKVTP